MSDLSADEPVIRQRVGAYGVLTRERAGRRELLLTRIAAKDYGAGMWTLPGGGIDHAEHPNAAVVREVYEETSLRVTAGAVVAVSSLHVVDRNRSGVLEDFQGIGIIYQVRADETADLDSLRVMEEDSSTDLVEWVTLEGARERLLTNVALAALEVLGA